MDTKEIIADDLSELVTRFSAALLEKLRAAEAKYGYSDNWKRGGWRDELAADLLEHVGKGDPRDVAAYCAFAWHHGWSIDPRPARLRVHELLRMYDECEGDWCKIARAVEDRCIYGQQPRYQSRVGEWMKACFGDLVTYDRAERNFRFLEEALELAQACGATVDDARQLIEYVFNRPVGEPMQEVGGVMVTLAALCNAHAIHLDEAQEAELQRVWAKIEQIRAKHASKPLDVRSALPGGAHV